VKYSHPSALSKTSSSRPPPARIPSCSSSKLMRKVLPRLAGCSSLRTNSASSGVILGTPLSKSHTAAKLRRRRLTSAAYLASSPTPADSSQLPTPGQISLRTGTASRSSMRKGKSSTLPTPLSRGLHLSCPHIPCCTRSSSSFNNSNPSTRCLRSLCCNPNSPVSPKTYCSSKIWTSE